MNKIYRTLETIEILVGDTLPIIELEIKTIDSNDKIVGVELELATLMLSKEGMEDKAFPMVMKASGRYEVLIKSFETTNWEEGEYCFWFRIVDKQLNEYRREGGIIKVNGINVESFKKRVGGED